MYRDFMEVGKSYRSIASPGEGLYKEKGSKFIGLAVRCYSEEEAKEFIDACRKEHHQARHWCYAYRFGLDGEVYRANDDGEPSNSAGAPILGAIQSFELTNILIVVVRYYGGTKLGVGGLINAYRTAAREAIESTKIISIEVYDHISLHFEYADMVPVMNSLKKWGIEMDKHSFEDTCTIECSLPTTNSAAICEELDSFETVTFKQIGRY